MTQIPGCIWLPNETAAYVRQRELDGIPCDVGQLGIDGAWKRLVERGVYGVFAGDSERQLRGGQESDVREQARGTCCSQGMAGAGQDTITYRIANFGAVGASHIDISAETIYAIGRAITGAGNYSPAGNNPQRDGLAVVHAAMALHRFGYLRRGKYGDVDMSGPRESWAIGWADTGRIPQSLLNACLPAGSAQKVETDRELADTAASGYFAGMGTTHQFSDRRDSNGMCFYQNATAHCEQDSGVFMLPSWDGRPETIYQNTGIVRRQSWSGVPGGPDVLRFKGGTYKLRRGEYGITLRDAYAALRTMETWTCSPPDELWRGN